jgi:hypothetical protein
MSATVPIKRILGVPRFRVDTVNKQVLELPYDITLVTGVAFEITQTIIEQVKITNGSRYK